MRKSWTPAIDHLHEALPGDYVDIYDTNGSGSPSSRITKIQPEGFHGTRGEGQLNLHSIGVQVQQDSTLRLFLNHHGQPLDKNGENLSGESFGANSTVEVFETTLGSNKMKHVRTYSNPLINTPNMVAPIDSDSFLVNNDHKEQTGLLRGLDLLKPRSYVVYCDPQGCKKAIDKKLAYPNGIIRGLEENIYTYCQASSAQGVAGAYELQPDRSLVLVSSKNRPSIFDRRYSLPISSLFSLSEDF